MFVIILLCFDKEKVELKYLKSFLNCFLNLSFLKVVIRDIEFLSN